MVDGRWWMKGGWGGRGSGPPSAIIGTRKAVRDFIEMEDGLKRRDLLHQAVGQFLARDNGIAGNIVDRLFGIKFGALAAGTVEDVDQMAFHVEQAHFKNRKQAARTRADDHRVGFDGFICHLCTHRSYLSKPVLSF